MRRKRRPARVEPPRDAGTERVAAKVAAFRELLYDRLQGAMRPFVGRHVTPRLLAEAAEAAQKSVHAALAESSITAISVDVVVDKASGQLTLNVRAAVDGVPVALLGRLVDEDEDEDEDGSDDGEG